MNINNYTERDIDMIRGKMLVNAATQEELNVFLSYVNELEALVEEASQEDFYGTEGWRFRVWNENEKLLDFLPS